MAPKWVKTRQKKRGKRTKKLKYKMINDGGKGKRAAHREIKENKRMRRYDD